jgi:hypothetical protein
MDWCQWWTQTWQLGGDIKKKKNIYIYSGGKTKKKLGINFYYYLIFFGKNS